MKRILKIILLLILPAFVFAQPQKTQFERLHLALKNAANDTIRMDVYMRLALYYNEINRDSALFYLAQGIPIAQNLKLKINEVRFLENRGYMYGGLGNYPRALEAYFQALKIAEDPASEKYVWNLPNGLTPRNFRLVTLGYTYLTLGHLYGFTGNNEKQISSYHQALAISNSVQKNMGLKALCNQNLGSTHLNLNQLDSALFYVQTALAIYSKNKGNNKYDGGAYNTIGQIYQAKGDYKLALEAFHKSAETHSRQNILTGLADNYHFLGAIYLTLGRIDSSLFYAGKSLEIAKTIKQPQRFADAYQILSDVYIKMNKKDSAFIFLKLASALRDSLNDVERKNLVSYQNLGFEEQLRLKKLEEEKIQMQNKIRTNTLAGSLFTLIVIAFFLYRNNRQKQKAKQNIEKAYEQLKSTQSQLIQSEKMASLGELTAGIAHEIQNPLNFVNNFAEVNSELISELKEEIEKGDKNEAINIANDIAENEQKIIHHGKRADAIVKGMLQHSRTSSGQKESTDINALADEYLRLAYHGMRAKDKSFNVDFKTDFDENLPKINVIPQDIGRVLLNLINNAFYAVQAPPPPEGGIQKIPTDYKPTVIVSTSYLPPSGGMRGACLVRVSDNGPGIPPHIVDKIFQPFFTTKPTGQGTGLGLSLSYDIVKAHGGELKVETKEGEGSEFIIQIPIKSLT